MSGITLLDCQQMSLVGNLADLPLTDIFQIVSLSKRTGILNITAPNGKASITFLDGNAIKASSSWNKLALGPFLKQKKLITDQDEAMVLEIQKVSPIPFGTILVQKNIVSRGQMEASLREYIQTVTVELLGLEEGKFQFQLLTSHKDVLPPDNIELILKDGVATQHLIIEGLRQLDENRHRKQTEKKKGMSDLDFSSLLEDGPVSVSEPVPPQEDDNTGHPEGLWESIQDEICVKEDPSSDQTEEKELGFIEQLFSEVGEDFELEPDDGNSSGEISNLKSMVEELKGPNSLSEVLLLALRYASEFANRAALFVVREKEVRGFGQFGLDGDDNLANERIRYTLIPEGGDSILNESIRTCSKVQRPLDLNNEWDSYLLERLGGDAPAEAVVLPVINNNQVIGLLYADSGECQDPVGDTQALEIFMIQAGFVLDRFLLESKLQDIQQ
jgi:hypothetical protein